MTKLALITGGGKKRVGFHIALALARKADPIAVHHHTTPPDEALAELRPLAGAEAFRADLSDEGQTRRMIDAVHARFGRIDVLVNAAAIWERKPLEQVVANDV